ncbi:MAG: GIY-YIG nuclease family protein [Desulfobacterales bacterium]|nr:GIY-YIG nuclease family protein [Desulfobacteraceae bacterium]MBT4364616.1 GIY-YIG nuclease family protein [Desulfobacteraceae bacterium]MBT7085662.1 GIY-YIG nuclease family protein [Desulfobacterales bacterium]
MNIHKWVVYLVRCSDKSLYCGITNDLKKRLEAHNSGKGAKYTRSRRPVKLVVTSSEMTKSDALKLEYRVKQVPADRKYYVLIEKENEIVMDLKETLNVVSRDIKVLANKVDELVKSINDG